MSNEVGKVSVRVIPDTRGFAFKAKQELNKLKDLTLKVKVELDDKKFKSQVNALVAETNAELMKPEKRIKLRASLEASERQLQSEVRDVRTRMQILASQEKVKLEAELSKSSSRKNGGSDILGLDPKKAVKALERELRGHHYELPVYANTSKAQADIRRMARSNKLGIDVDLNVDRKAIHKDVESISELIKTTAKALGQTKALKFAVDVDKASVKKWGDEVRKVEASLEKQQKAYRNTQRELKIVTDRAADYGRAVSDATKRIAKIKAEEVADLEREQELTNELAKVRETIARTVGDTTDQVLREKRIVGQISNLRANAFDRSAKRADAEAKAVAEIRDASREITRLKKERALLAKDEIKNYGEIQSLLVDEKRLQKQLDRARNKLEMDAIELDVNLDQTSVEAVSARLIQLSRDRVATIWVNMQKANLARMKRDWGIISKHTSSLAVNTTKWMGQLTGVRVLWKTFSDMVQILPRLDMMVPQLAQNLALITAGTAGAAGGVGLLFTLLSDIGEVGKLIIGLPAAIAGIAGSALIVGRALQDFKTVFPEIISYYEELGEVVSDRVWKQAAGPIRELHKATKPLLDANIPEWATAWGDSMASLATGLGSMNGLGNLEIFLKNSILGTKNATKGWESLGNAIMSMIGGGSDVFPDLGTWFTDTMADFEIWAQKNQSQIGKWLREGGTALRELGSIGVSTVKIVAGLADAFEAAGWPGLTELERGMKSIGESALGLSENGKFMWTLHQIEEFFSSIKTLGPQAGKAMENAWLMVGDAVDQLTGPITGALGGILDGFNSSKFQEGFGTFIDGLGSFIEDVTPGIEAMTAEIGSLLGVVGTAGESWGPAFNDMLLLFSSAGDKLHPGLIDFIENTGPELQELVQDITPHVEDFAEALSDLLGNKNFQDLIGDLIGDLGDLGGMILDLGTWVLETAEKFSDWYGGLSEGQQDFVRWGAIIAGALGGVGLAISRLLVGVGKFVFSIPGVLPAIGRALVKAFPVGGLLKIARPILARFAGLLSGPVGWALLIASIIRPIDFANMADWVVDALGFEDTWLGRFTEAIKKNFEEKFGDDSLLDIVLDNLGDAFSSFAEGDWAGGITSLIKGLIPAFNFIDVVGDAILEALGLDPGKIDAAKAEMEAMWDEGGIRGLWDGFWEAFKASNEKAWDEFTTKFFGYEFPSPIEAAGILKDKLLKALGFGGGGESTPVEGTQSGSSSSFNLLGASLSGDWGAPTYEQGVKPYLDRGYGTLQERIAGWSPEGDSGLGSAIDRALGTDDTSTARTAGAFSILGQKAAEFAIGVVGSYGSMGEGGRREIAGLTDNTETEFGSMSNKSQGDARSMNSGVVGQFSAMATRAVAQAARLQVGAQRAMAQANAQMVAQGRAANTGFVAQMVAMAARAISIVNTLRNGLQSALRINASGSGQYTGSTFVSGLASGLSRAVGVARGMAGSVRGALRFSAFSSGAAVGGTFASGLRARVRSVASAASQLASAARARLPNSPADEGPFSGSGWGGWGESIAEEMAKGLRKAAPEVAREANRMMSGVNDALGARAEIAPPGLTPAGLRGAVNGPPAGALANDGTPITRLSDEDRALLEDIAGRPIEMDGRLVSKANNRSKSLRGVF